MGLLTGLLGALPFIGTAIQGIETLFGPGNGSTKKAAALSVIGAGLNIFGTATNNPQLQGTNLNDIMTAIGNEIDATVALYNALGVFTHGAATSVSTPATKP